MAIDIEQAKAHTRRLELEFEQTIGMTLEAFREKRATLKPVPEAVKKQAQLEAERWLREFGKLNKKTKPLAAGRTLI